MLNDGSNNHDLRHKLADLKTHEEADDPALEERVVGAALRKGLIRGERRGRIWIPIAVAALLAFAVGIGAGRLLFVPKPSQYTFVLFLEEGPAYQPASAGQEQQRVAEYGAWARSLREKGVAVTGMKLDSGSNVMGSGPGGTAQAAGLFAVDAKDLETAKKIAESCPHLRYGGQVVIRPVART